MDADDPKRDMERRGERGSVGRSLLDPWRVKRVSVLRAGQRLEHASLGIADRQQSGADCEIGGMQL